MRNLVKTLVVCFGTSLGFPLMAVELRERTDRSDQGLIHESAPAPSGIYNLRRPQSKLPNSKKSPHRKPRLKSARETIAART